MTRVEKIEKALIKKLNSGTTCSLTFKGCGETVLLHYQGESEFYAKRNENWYLGQPEKCRRWVVTATLKEMAEWIAKYC